MAKPKKKTDAELEAEGVIIAAAVGKADNGGREQSIAIEAAMAQAIHDMNAMGIADDTRSEALVEILGSEWEGKVGADAIREAKLAARTRVKEEFRRRAENAREEEAARLAAEGQ